MSNESIFHINSSLLISVVLLLITGISVYLQFRPQNLELTMEVLTSQELTKTADVSGLSAEYQYQGENVEHLWKFETNIINTGDKTIIGKGTNKNIISDKINFALPDSFKIIKIDTLGSDLINSNLSATENFFSINFDQWRVNENLLISIYAKNSNRINNSTLPKNISRDLVDGNIVVLDKTSKLTKQEDTYLSKLPTLFRYIVLVVVYGLVFLTALFTLLMPFETILDIFRYLNWKAKNYKDYKNYIENLDLEVDYKKKLLKYPQTLSNDIWDNFEGEKLSLEMVHDSWPSAIIGSLLLWVLCFSIIVFFLSIN